MYTAGSQERQEMCPKNAKGTTQSLDTRPIAITYKGKATKEQVEAAARAAGFWNDRNSQIPKSQVPRSEVPRSRDPKTLWREDENGKLFHPEYCEDYTGGSDKIYEPTEEDLEEIGNIESSDDNEKRHN